MDLLIPLVVSERSRKSIRYWGAKLWNSIPDEIRRMPTLQAFSALYESYLRTKVNEFDDSYNLYDFV